MPILDAALAFALTMLLVASTVTLSVRVIQGFLGTRSKMLGEMLDRYFAEELQPVIVREANRLAGRLKEEGRSAVAAAAAMLSKESVFKGKDVTRLIELSTEELTENIKRSQLGEELLRRLGDEAQTTFTELGRRYDAIGKQATESFKKNSRKWCTVVALVVALGVNIDSINVASAFVTKESLREGVIAQLDAVVGRYEAAVGSVNGNSVAADSVTMEQLEQAIEQTRNQIDFLASSGLPIGWSYYPHGCYGTETTDCEQRNGTRGFVMWLLGVVLTAVLAGLGGPFWYDTVVGISRVAHKARAPRERQQ